MPTMNCPKCNSKNYFKTLVDYIGKDRNTCTCSSCNHSWKACDYDKEVIRGAEPRYWEDVEIGEELPHVVKGPLHVVDILVHLMAGGSPMFRAYRIRRDYEKKHPSARTLWDEQEGEYTVPELVHFYDHLARSIGAPGAYDYGGSRIGYMAQMITHWIGDDGWLWKIYGELR